MNSNELATKSDLQVESKPNRLLLMVFLLIAVILAIGFLPSMNAAVPKVAEATAVSTSSAAFGPMLDSLKYEKSIHILAMLLVGFGFLMVFVRKHGFSSITATFLVVSVSLPLYMLLKSFGGGESAMPVVSMDTFIFAEFAAASLLIAIGAPLGRLKMDHYIIIALLFIPAYIFNEWLILESGYFKGFLDTGGSIVIHAFGAYFGLGLVANTLSKFKDSPTCENDALSNQFCLVGSMVLWLFWPSFTGALVAPSEVPLTAINTVFALCGATLATYVLSKWIRGKIEIEDIANASLAGGVAIGTACNMVTPGYALLIGIAAGALSTVGYTLIAPKVEKWIKGSDTCGIHNLHGMPGVLGGLTGVLVTGHAGVQVAGIAVTVILAFGFGKVSGFILSKFGEKELTYSDADEFILEH